MLIASFTGVVGRASGGTGGRGRGGLFRRGSDSIEKADPGDVVIHMGRDGRCRSVESPLIVPKSDSVCIMGRPRTDFEGT